MAGSQHCPVTNSSQISVALKPLAVGAGIALDMVPGLEPGEDGVTGPGGTVSGKCTTGPSHKIRTPAPARPGHEYNANMRLPLTF